MIHVRRHQRITNGRSTTVRAHDRDGAPATRRPAIGADTVWDDGTPPPEDAYWDYDAGCWVRADDEQAARASVTYVEPADKSDTGAWSSVIAARDLAAQAPQPGDGMSSAFRAMVAQNPELDNERYRKLRALRQGGYGGWVDENGEVKQGPIFGVGPGPSRAEWGARTAEQRQAALGELRDAREELERISKRDRCESEDYHAANSRVIAAENNVPRWRRG